MDVLGEVEKAISMQGISSQPITQKPGGEEQLEKMRQDLGALEKQVADLRHLLGGALTLMVHKGLATMEELTEIVKPTLKPTTLPALPPPNKTPPGPLPVVRLSPNPSALASTSSLTPGVSSNCAHILTLSKTGLELAKKDAPDDTTMSRILGTLKEQHKGLKGGLSIAKALLEPHQSQALAPSSFAAAIFALKSFLGRADHSIEPDEALKKKAEKFERSPTRPAGPGGFSSPSSSSPKPEIPSMLVQEEAIRIDDGNNKSRDSSPETTPPKEEPEEGEIVEDSGTAGSSHQEPPRLSSVPAKRKLDPDQRTDAHKKRRPTPVQIEPKQIKLDNPFLDMDLKQAREQGWRAFFFFLFHFGDLHLSSYS